MRTIHEPLHWTTLKHIARSPAHLVAAIENPKDTPPMRLGRLVHTIVLGGPPSAVWDGTRRGKEWEAFKAANEGREIVTRDEVERATKIANAVQRSPVAAPVLNGVTEYAVEWEALGRKCATRGIDIHNHGENFLADLKTTTNAEPDKFRRACLGMGYHAQLAWYMDAAAAIGKPVTRAYIIGVETAPPFAVTVLHVTARTLELGRQLNRLWLERFISCEAANEWPGYVQSIVDLDVGGDDVGIIIDGDDEEVAA